MISPLAGSIMGTNGKRLESIKSATKTEITMERLRPGETERLITIIGTDKQCEHAQFLLQKA